MTDELAAILNLVTALLCFRMAMQGFKVGKHTGNVSWWVIFTIGWILVGFARVMTAILFDFLSIPNSRDIGLIIIIIALFLMLYGMNNFTRIVLQRVKNHE